MLHASCSIQYPYETAISYASMDTPLPRLPVQASTAATLHEELVIVGGERDGSSINSIHQLVDRHWVKIGSMFSGIGTCV